MPPRSLSTEWGTRWHGLRLSLLCGLPMLLYALLPCRATAWLGLWALMDDAWAQLDDPLVQQLLAMFRRGGRRCRWLPAARLRS